MSIAKLNATGIRWVRELAENNFTIHYRPGKCNGDADDLSRMPLMIDKLIKESTQQLNRNILNATAQAIHIKARGSTYLTEVAKNYASADIDVITTRCKEGRLERIDILQHQMQDQHIH